MSVPATTPFVAHLGICHLPADATEGVFEAVVEVVPHLLNRSNVAHGGLLASLLDTVMARAAAADSSAPNRMATIEMKVSFIGPGRGLLRARAWRLQRTASLSFCEAEVRDAEGGLIAKASATYKHGRAAADG